MLTAFSPLWTCQRQKEKSCDLLGVLPHRWPQHPPVKLSILSCTLSVSY